MARFELDKWAVLDVVRAKLLMLVENETEGWMHLHAAFPKLPDADLADTGFDVVPVRVTIQLLPIPKDALRYRHQRTLFAGDEGKSHEPQAQDA